MLPATVDVPDIRQLKIPGFVAPVGNTVVTLLDTIPVTTPGVGILLSCWIMAVDASVPADWRVTVQEQGYRVFAGNLAAITAIRLDTQTAGGAGSFAADVSFIAVQFSAPGRLELVAANGGAASRTGNLLIRYWVSRAAW